MKFPQIERGDQQFFCCFQGGYKFNRVFHPVSATHPRELKNDNSLNKETLPGERFGHYAILKSFPLDHQVGRQLQRNVGSCELSH